MKPVVSLWFLLSLFPLLLGGCSDLLGYGSSGKKTQADISLDFNVNEAKTVFILNEFTPPDNDSNPTFVSSRLYAVDHSDEVYLAQAGSEPLPLVFTTVNPDANYLYAAIDLSQLKSNGSVYRLIEKNNCTVYKVSLQDNSTTCALQGIAIDQYDTNQWELIASNVKPVQFDDHGGIYFLGRSFVLECFTTLNSTRYSNGDKVCADNQQDIKYGDYSMIYHVSIEGAVETIAKTDETITSFIVFPKGEIAYVSLNSQTETLNLKTKNGIIEVNKKLGSISNFSIFNDQTMLWNTTEVVHWSDLDVSFSSINTHLVPEGEVAMDHGRVYVKSDDLLFQLLPPQVKAKSSFLSPNNVPALVSHGYAIYLRELVESELLKHHIVLYDIEKNSETLLLVDKSWHVNQWSMDGGRLIFSAIDQLNNSIVIGEVSMLNLNKTGDESDFLKSSVISDMGKNQFLVVDFESIASVGEPKLNPKLHPELSSEAPYISEIHMLADNRNSISIDFSQSMNPTSIIENLSLQGSTLSNINYLPLWQGNTLHLIIDTDGFTNNELVFQNDEFKVVNQQQLLPVQELMLSVNAAALAENGHSLGGYIDIANYPLNKTFTTISDGKTYLANAEKFNREIGDTPSSLVEGAVLAHAPCVSTCSESEYDLGILEKGNIRHEFSVSSNKFELTLWNKTKYSASYNVNDSHDLQIKFLGNKIIISIGEQEAELELAENDSRYWLSKSNIWRRYRIDMYNEKLQISYSIDNSNYTVINELLLTNVPNYSTSTDEYTWLLSFSGAIDQWSSSSLTINNTLLNSAGDLLSLTFNTDSVIPGDTGEGDEIGFDDNIAGSYPLTAGPGSPDDSFGLKGGVYFGGVTDWFGDSSAMTIDASGRILLAAKVINTQAFDMAVWRITADGDLDTMFGIDGLTTHHNAAGGNNHDVAEAVVVDPNSGMIYVTGVSYNGFAYDMTLWRLTDDGKLDTTFNNQGYVTYTTTDTDNSGYAIAIDSNGRIIIAGESSSRPTIWAYLPSGDLDTSFNGTGVFSYGNTSGRLTSVIIDNNNISNDNNIIVTGNMIISVGDTDMLLLKVSQHGTEIFGKLYDGVNNGVENNEGNATYGVSVQLDYMQNYVVFGYELNLTGYDLVMWRLDENGIPDSDFASGSATEGRIHYDSSDNDFAYSMAIDRDGKIYLLASSSTQNTGLYVIRYDMDGNYDNTFDADGVLYRTGYSGRILTHIDDNNEEKVYVSGMRVLADGFEGERGVWRINP